MRFFLVAIALSVLGCFGCSTQATPTSSADSYRTTGVIKKIDLEKNLVTIDHEEIPGYMPAMEMTEDTIDVNMLKAFRVGDIVEFDMERTGSELIITNLAKNGVNDSVFAAHLYTENCAKCHGSNGEGAEKGIPLTTGHALHHSEADHLNTVTNGKNLKKEKHMPAFQDKLPEADIRALVRYVREDIQKGTARPDDKKDPNHGHKH